MTDTSRRTLLRASAFGLLLAPLTSVRAAFAATTSLYSRSRFTKLTNARFTLSSTAGTWTVTLVKVSDLAGAPRRADNRFCLTFTSAAAGPVQGSYLLKRSGFTETELFVVPSDPARQTHQVIVNRV